MVHSMTSSEQPMMSRRTKCNDNFNVEEHAVCRPFQFPATFLRILNCSNENNYGSHVVCPSWCPLGEVTLKWWVLWDGTPCAGVRRGWAVHGFSSAKGTGMGRLSLTLCPFFFHTIKSKKDLVGLGIRQPPVEEQNPDKVWPHNVAWFLRFAFPLLWFGGGKHLNEKIHLFVSTDTAVGP